MIQERATASSPRRAHRAALGVLIVALMAVAAWAVAPGAGATVRAGSQVTGAAVKQTGPVAARSTRGALAGPVARAGQQLVAAQRTVATDLGGTHGAPLLALLTTLVALAVASRRRRVTTDFIGAPSRGALELSRGRAPPTGVPTPA